MGNVNTLFLPGDPRALCFAILSHFTSELKFVNLEGESSSSVKIYNHRFLGIVTNDGEVYALTNKEILKLRSGGRKTVLRKLRHKLARFSEVVSFQKKIYIIQPLENSMLYFDAADNSLTDDLPGCGLGDGFCASATDDFIYAMGGEGTTTRAMKYDPLGITWEETAPMRNERYNAAAATLNGKIYVVGGQVTSGPGLLHSCSASAEYYNPGNNSWTETTDMKFGRKDFNACVVGDRLYAVGGDRSKAWDGTFYDNSIEVYDKNEWTVVTQFKTKNYWTYSCFWPHVSHQPDPTHRDMPEFVEMMFNLLKNQNLLKTNRKIGSKKENIEYAGCKISLSEGVLKEEKEVALSACIGVDQKNGTPDITPTFECDPPVTFEKPVSMTLRTCISAPAGKEIPATLLTRDHPGEEWKETKQLSVGSRNQVDFEIQHFGGIKVAAKSSDINLLHSINGFHINLDTGMTAVTFSKDQAVYDAVEKSMCKSGFVDFAVIPHEILGKFGSEISVSMEQKKPEDITISEAFPSPTFALDEEYLLKGKQIVYFELDPEPSDQCRMISMQYGYKVSGELERHLPLKTKWPRKETNGEDANNKLRGATLDDCKFHGGDEEIDCDGNIVQKNFYNCSFYPTANQVAIGGGTITEIITGSVGQVATGNANITNQGSENNFVAGSQENTDRSVTAGKAIYGQSTSSSVGENITVNRSGT